MVGLIEPSLRQHRPGKTGAARDGQLIPRRTFNGGVPSAAFARLGGPCFTRVAGGFTSGEWIYQEGSIVDIGNLSSQLSAGLLFSVTAEALADAVGQDVPLHGFEPAVEIARLRCAAAIQAEQQTRHRLHGAAGENQHKGRNNAAAGDACKRCEEEKEKAHSRRDQSPEEASARLSSINPVTGNHELKLGGCYLLDVFGVGFGEAVDGGAHVREVSVQTASRGVQGVGQTIASYAYA